MTALEAIAQIQQNHRKIAAMDSEIDIPALDSSIQTRRDGFYLITKDGAETGPYAFTEAVDKAVAMGRKESV